MKKTFPFFVFIISFANLFSQTTMTGFSVGGGGSSLPSQTGNSGKYLTTDGTNTSWGTPGGGGTVTSVTVTPNAGITGTSSGGSTPALTLSLGKITPSAVSVTDSVRVGTTAYCNYPLRIRENSTGGGLKIGNNVDDGGDHQSALNINEKHTSNTSQLYRALKIEDEWQAQQYWNMWQGVFTQRFTGTATYSQAGGAPAPYQCGNLVLGLEGTNPNVTIPNYIYQVFTQPGLSANTGSFAGTLGDLYYVYCQDLTAGANNYLWYSGSGKFRLGDKLWNTAPNLAHGMTGFLPTNTYFEQTIGNATNGGLVINSATSSGSVTPTAFNAISGATPTVPCFIFNAGKKLNTSYTILASNEIHTEFRNGGGATPIIQIMANGHMGIGATSPANMLTITQGAGETTQALKINANGGNNSAALYVDQQNATGRGLLFNMVSTAQSDYVADFRVGGNSVVYFGGDGKVGIGTSTASKTLDVVGDIALSGATFCASTQTSVNASTSGTVKFSQPQRGSTYKMVIITGAAALGTASYTFPTAFTVTPSIVASNDVAAGVVTSLSTTAVTVTGATTTGTIMLIGY